MADMLLFDYNTTIVSYQNPMDKILEGLSLRYCQEKEQDSHSYGSSFYYLLLPFLGIIVSGPFIVSLSLFYLIWNLSLTCFPH
jgi:hypothetical protein